MELEFGFEIEFDKVKVGVGDEVGSDVEWHESEEIDRACGRGCGGDVWRVVEVGAKFEMELKPGKLGLGFRHKLEIGKVKVGVGAGAKECGCKDELEPNVELGLDETELGLVENDWQWG